MLALICSACFILGVMQATTMGGCKLEKRYSPSFRDEPQRKMSASKRKRDDILRWVSFCQMSLVFVGTVDTIRKYKIIVDDKPTLTFSE